METVTAYSLYEVIHQQSANVMKDGLEQVVRLRVFHYDYERVQTVVVEMVYA